MIKWLFRIAPKVGSKWVYDTHQRDPFYKEIDALVITTKDGWVQFSRPTYHQPSFLSSYSVRMFRELFREVL